MVQATIASSDLESQSVAYLEKQLQLEEEIKKVFFFFLFLFFFFFFIIYCGKFRNLLKKRKFKTNLLPSWRNFVKIWIAPMMKKVCEVLSLNFFFLYFFLSFLFFLLSFPQFNLKKSLKEWKGKLLKRYFSPTFIFLIFSHFFPRPNRKWNWRESLKRNKRPETSLRHHLLSASRNSLNFLWVKRKQEKDHWSQFKNKLRFPRGSPPENICAHSSSCCSPPLLPPCPFAQPQNN